MIQYGLISETDARTLEKTIDLICSCKTGFGITITEIGVYSGGTAKGLRDYCYEKHKALAIITGIDNQKIGQEIIHKNTYNELIIGESNEVYNKIKNESQDLVFIDGLHTFAGVISDFFCYAPKVKKGGFLAFHDTGKYIDPLHGWQGVGDKNDPDFCLGGVRKALKAIGLLGGIEITDNYKFFRGRIAEWELIFDEADEADLAGGICVFKKI